MTPLDDKGETAADLKNQLAEVDEKLQSPSLTREENADLSFKVRRLKRRVESIERGAQTTDDNKIADPTVRSMRQELRRLQDTVSKFVVGNDPVLQKVEPYLQEVLDENPELMTIEDADRRIRLARAAAREKYDEDHPEESGRSEDRVRDTSRAFRTGGGAPVQNRSRGSQSAQLKYEAELRSAKTAEEKKAVTDRFLATHPED